MKRMNLHTRKYRSYLLVIFPLFITVLLWIFAKEYRGVELTFDQTPRYLSQVFALLGTVLLSMSYILVTRLPQVEKFYGGLDKIYKLHSLISKWATVLILAHPLLLVVEAIPDIESVGSYVLPLHQYNNDAQNFGIIALYLYLILIVISIFRFLPYQLWKYTHMLIGIPFFFAAYHGIEAESDVKRYWVLYAWIMFWIVIGVLAYIYKTLLYNWIGPKYLYKLTDVKYPCDVIELYMKPVGRRLNFEPGQFVFTSFIKNDRVPREQHPFSISSSIDEDILRLSFKEYGDYTHKLKNAKKGDMVYLFGPHGDFTSYAFSQFKKQIWIAGGIGVTPFMSMLYYEAHNKDKKDIVFFYSGREEDDCVYAKEIETILEDTDDRFTYSTHFSNEQGFLTAKQIIEKVEDINDYVILMCGPPAMLENLSKQFKAEGVDPDYIVFEEFDLV